MSAIAFHRSLDRRRDALALSANSLRRGIFRRVGDAIMRSNQRRAERDIARWLGQSSGRLTDEIERRITEHLTRNGNFRP